MRLSTVNVIECLNSDRLDISQLVSFADDADGNKQAEELFVRLVKETASDTSDAAIESYLDDGYCQIGEGFVAIIHSTGWAPDDATELAADANAANEQFRTGFMK